MKGSQPVSVEGPDGRTGRDAAPDYSREWKVYARRRGLALVLLWGVAPICAAAYVGSQRWPDRVLESTGLALAWVVAMCVAVWWAGEFRCPRCRRRVAALGAARGLGMVWRGLFDEVCANCKLRRWEMGSG